MSWKLKYSHFVLLKDLIIAVDDISFVDASIASLQSDYYFVRLIFGLKSGKEVVWTSGKFSTEEEAEKYKTNLLVDLVKALEGENEQ